MAAVRLTEAALCVEQFARFAAPAPLLGTLVVINQLVTRDAEPSVCQEIFDGNAIWAATVTRDLTALAQTPDSAWAVDCASAEGAAVFEPERLVVCGIETMPWPICLEGSVVLKHRRSRMRYACRSQLQPKRQPAPSRSR